MTTKGLRHIQMRENAIREQVQLGLITVEHISGKQNLADSFTKEEKDNYHFITCRNLLLQPPPSFHTNNTNTTTTNENNNSNEIADRQTVTDTNGLITDTLLHRVVDINTRRSRWYA